MFDIFYFYRVIYGILLMFDNFMDDEKSVSMI